MAEPNVGDLSTMTSQYYDVDVLSASGAAPAATTTPTSTVQKFWRGINVTGAGNLVVDTLGLGGVGGKTNVTIPVAAGPLQLAVTKVYNTTTATGVTGLY